MVLLTAVDHHSNNNNNNNDDGKSIGWGAKTTKTEDNDDLGPTNVDSVEKLAGLPDEVLSGDPHKPLIHKDEIGDTFTYVLKPMFYSVIYILLVELLERFAFYGLNYTSTAYLTGVYNPSWNAGFTAIAASSYVSISTAVAYTSPFCGAYMADVLLGDFWTIVVGVLLFYIPGVLLIALTTIPGFLGQTFNVPVLTFAFLFLWPLGTGAIKSVVNVFGAKQFHPLLQSSLIETYYVNFYMCINIGALIGGIVVPIEAQHNIVVAYFIPLAMLVLGFGIFLLGSARYNKARPQGELCKDGNDDKGNGPSKVNVLQMLALSSLIIPFNIAYSQMSTTFIVQGTVMQRAFGFLDAAGMNNADAISVLLFGYLIGSKLYPFLASHGIKLLTTQKFAIGSLLGASSILWALLVEHMIHRHYHHTGGKISVLWQAPSYLFIGAGEIFAVSSAYEVAFTTAPPEKKALASAVNLFAIGGIPNILCVFLYHICATWFHNNAGTSNISSLPLYDQAHVYKYYLLLFFIALSGVGLNLLPAVQNWVLGVEQQAESFMRTPKPATYRKRVFTEEDNDDEESIRAKMAQHKQYLEEGTGPTMYKSGSMRAGPFLRRSDDKQSERMKRAVERKLARMKSAPIALLPPKTSRGGGANAEQQQQQQQRSVSEGPVV